MHHDPARHSRAEEAALETYFRLRAAGQAHQRALSAAIVRLVRSSAAIDGREARARVIAGLRSRGVVPVDREEWITTAAASEAWRRGAREAIVRLSAECRRPFPEPGAPVALAEAEFDMVGAGAVADYLRAQMPAKVARLRRDVMRLFADPASPLR